MEHYLTPNWTTVPKSVKAYTSLRFGGHSQGAYSSFNLSAREDDPYCLENRTQLCRELGLQHPPIWLNQVHGIHAVQADQVENTPEADASFTRVHGVVCAVLTADCLPILISNAEGTEVAAIHAGWKGLLAGVIESTLKQLYSPGNALSAWLGPAIGPKNFEVGDEVKEAFIAQNPDSRMAFTAIEQGKSLANIYQLAKQRLTACGVFAISGGELCTYADSSRFFSFRRDQGVTGRMASLIWIEE